MKDMKKKGTQYNYITSNQVITYSKKMKKIRYRKRITNPLDKCGRRRIPKLCTAEVDQAR